MFISNLKQFTKTSEIDIDITNKIIESLYHITKGDIKKSLNILQCIYLKYGYIDLSLLKSFKQKIIEKERNLCYSIMQKTIRFERITQMISKLDNVLANNVISKNAFLEYAMNYILTKMDLSNDDINKYMNIICNFDKKNSSVRSKSLFLKNFLITMTSVL